MSISQLVAKINVVYIRLRLAELVPDPSRTDGRMDRQTEKHDVIAVTLHLRIAARVNQ